MCAIVLEQSTGKELQMTGMAQAADSAGDFIRNWNTLAYDFLVAYARNHIEFMAEDVRNCAVRELPAPPSLRAWGGIIFRAKRNKVIQHIRFTAVKNAKAHCARASVWRSLVYINPTSN